MNDNDVIYYLIVLAVLVGFIAAALIAKPYDQRTSTIRRRVADGRMRVIRRATFEGK